MEPQGIRGSWRADISQCSSLRYRIRVALGGVPCRPLVLDGSTCNCSKSFYLLQDCILSSLMQTNDQDRSYNHSKGAGCLTCT